MTQYMNQRRSINQQGIVSIMVTMLMMIVISLIVLGFAQVSRRESSDALDRQLSTQAFLAAESGVNDAHHQIDQQLINAQPIAEKTSCATSTSDANYPFDPHIDTTHNVSYTCLLVNTHVKNLTASVAPDTSSVTIPVESGGGIFTKMNLAFTASNKVTTLTGCKASVPASAEFDRKDDWKCAYGVLELTMVPTDTISRAALDSGQKTMYLYPTTASGTLPTVVADGAVAPMKCTLAGCSINLIGFTSTKYAFKVGAIYNSGDFNITAQDAGGAVELKNGQIQVDSTGRAQDVLRRIQVRLPYTPGATAADYALESGSSVCKRFTYSATTFMIPTDIVGQDTTNPMCNSISITPPPPSNVCTALGPNYVVNGDFTQTLPENHIVTAASGFTTPLPYRGLNQFPDDKGQNGSNADTRGWVAGMTIFDSVGIKNGGYVYISQFNGDSALKDGSGNSVLPNDNHYHYFYSNPGQTISEPKGDPSRLHQTTYSGPIWSTTILNLKPNTTYTLNGYVANPLTSKYYASAHVRTVNPVVTYTINGKKYDQTSQTIQPDPDKSSWQQISLKYTTDATETSATFTINDSTNWWDGNDFVMTGIGVYECLN